MATWLSGPSQTQSPLAQVQSQGFYLLCQQRGIQIAGTAVILFAQGLPQQCHLLCQRWSVTATEHSPSAQVLSQTCCHLCLWLCHTTAEPLFLSPSHLSSSHALVRLLLPQLRHPLFLTRCATMQHSMCYNAAEQPCWVRLKPSVCHS